MRLKKCRGWRSRSLHAHCFWSTALNLRPCIRTTVPLDQLHFRSSYIWTQLTPNALLNKWVANWNDDSQRRRLTQTSPFHMHQNRVYIFSYYMYRLFANRNSCSARRNIRIRYPHTSRAAAAALSVPYNIHASANRRFARRGQKPILAFGQCSQTFSSHRLCSFLLFFFSPAIYMNTILLLCSSSFVCECICQDTQSVRLVRQ